MTRVLRTRPHWGTSAARALAFALAVASFAGSAAAQSPSVALITAVTGEVAIHHPATPFSVRAVVGSALAGGDSLDVAPGGSAVLLFEGGQLRRFDRSARIEAPAAAPRSGLLARAVQTLAQVASTDLRAQPNRQGMIRPLPGAVVLRYPRNDILLADPRPTFAWTPVSGATRYRLLLQSQDGEVQRFGPIADTLWTLPADAAPLSAGQYSWTVAAETRGRPAESQLFRIPDAARRQALEAELTALRGNQVSAATDLLLAEAIVYHSAGFQYEARRRIEELLADNGDASPVVHHLHAVVLDALGEGDAAEQALRRETPAPLPPR